MQDEAGDLMQQFITKIGERVYDRMLAEVRRNDWGDALRNVYQYDFILSMGFPVPARYPTTIGNLLKEARAIREAKEMDDDYKKKLDNLFVGYRYVVELADTLSNNSAFERLL